MGEYRGRLLSAQSQVMEPPHLWQERIDPPWQAEAPRVDVHGEYGDQLLIKGASGLPLHLSGAFAQLHLKSTADPVKINQIAEPAPLFRYGNGETPQQRLQRQADQQLDGEVLYPTLGSAIFTADDGLYQHAACRVYNTWLAEFVSHDPTRLKAMALLPARTEIDAIADEARRAAALGHVGVILPARNALLPYNAPQWDLLWGELESLGLVCVFHLGAEEGAALSPTGPGASGILLSSGKYELNEVLQMLVWGGAAMRYPGMRWGLVGSGTGWLATQVNLMDHWWNDHKGWMEPRLQKAPSLYWLCQFHATFNEDPPGVATHEISGVGNQLWSVEGGNSDAETFRAQVARTLGHLPADALDQMVHGNTARLFGFVE